MTPTMDDSIYEYYCQTSQYLTKEDVTAFEAEFDRRTFTPETLDWYQNERPKTLHKQGMRHYLLLFCLLS